MLLFSPSNNNFLFISEFIRDLRAPALEELHGKVRQRGGVVDVKLDPLSNPNLTEYPDRPSVWDPAVQVKVGDGPFGVNIASVDQYKWGHPNTGARFPLPRIPLDPASQVNSAVRAVDRGQGFPSERLFLSKGRQGFELRTGGAHGQFDYSRNDNGGQAAIRLDRWLLALETPLADDLELQVGEGAIALGADLLDRLDTSTEWSDLMQTLRARVEARRVAMEADKGNYSFELGGERMLATRGGF